MGLSGNYSKHPGNYCSSLRVDQVSESESTLADLIFVLVIGCFLFKSRSMRSSVVARISIGKTFCNQSTEISKIESADLIKTKINDYIQLGCDIFVSFLPTHTIAKCFISLSVCACFSHVPKHSIPLELRQLCLPCPVDSNLN